MSIIKNISILKLLILPFLIKNYSIYKSIFILLSYSIVSYLFNLIIKTIKKINYENTFKGILFTYVLYIYNKYYYKIKTCVYYTLAITFNFISIFRKYMPTIILDTLQIRGPLNIWSCIFSLIMFIYHIVSDLLKIYGK